jgi:hypothetical protein
MTIIIGGGVAEMLHLLPYRGLELDFYIAACSSSGFSHVFSLAHFA